MTAMTGDKGGGVLKDPSPCMDKVAEYFGTIRVKTIFLTIFDKVHEIKSLQIILNYFMSSRISLSKCLNSTLFSMRILYFNFNKNELNRTFQRILIRELFLIEIQAYTL